MGKSGIIEEEFWVWTCQRCLFDPQMELWNCKLEDMAVAEEFGAGNLDLGVIGVEVVLEATWMNELCYKRRWRREHVWALSLKALHQNWDKTRRFIKGDWVRAITNIGEKARRVQSPESQGGKCFKKEAGSGTSLQWFRLQGAWVLSLFREVRSPHAAQEGQSGEGGRKSQCQDMEAI